MTSENACEKMDPSTIHQESRTLPFPGPNLRVARRVKISLEDYLRETTEEQKEVLQRELSSAIVRSLTEGSSVYLEGFGLLSPTSDSNQRNRVLSSKQIVWHETELSVNFEKCFDVGSIQRMRSRSLTDTGDLATLISPYIPPHFQWDDHTIRRYIRGFIKNLQHETIVNGKSMLLDSLGTFYALHNRQGTTLTDWFAGSDIFLKQNFQYTLSTRNPRIYERPVMRDAWELFETAYGPAHATLKVSVREELEMLGYETEQLSSCRSPLDLHLKIFVQDTGSDSLHVLFCTDGLRRSGYNLNIRNPEGIEYVFQLTIPKPAQHNDIILPDWPLRLLTLGWILLESSRTACPGIGIGLGCDSPLISEQDQKFSSREELSIAFITPFEPFSSEYLCESGGSFRYLNLLGISAQEAELARHSSAAHLLDLLKYKKLDQITYPGRSSLIHDEEPCVQRSLASAG